MIDCVERVVPGFRDAIASYEVATPLTHHEVTEVADRVAGSLRAVLAEFLRTLAAADGARA